MSRLGRSPTSGKLVGARVWAGVQKVGGARDAARAGGARRTLRVEPAQQFPVATMAHADEKTLVDLLATSGLEEDLPFDRDMLGALRQTGVLAPGFGHTAVEEAAMKRTFYEDMRGPITLQPLDVVKKVEALWAYLKNPENRARMPGADRLLPSFWHWAYAFASLYVRISKYVAMEKLDPGLPNGRSGEAAMAAWSSVVSIDGVPASFWTMKKLPKLTGLADDADIYPQDGEHLAESLNIFMNKAHVAMGCSAFSTMRVRADADADDVVVSFKTRIDGVLGVKLPYTVRMRFLDTCATTTVFNPSMFVSVLGPTQKGSPAPVGGRGAVRVGSYGRYMFSSMAEYSDASRPVPMGVSCVLRRVHQYAIIDIQPYHVKAKVYLWYSAVEVGPLVLASNQMLRTWPFQRNILAADYFALDYLDRPGSFPHHFYGNRRWLMQHMKPAVIRERPKHPILGPDFVMHMPPPVPTAVSLWDPLIEARDVMRGTLADFPFRLFYAPTKVDTLNGDKEQLERIERAYYTQFVAYIFKFVGEPGATRTDEGDLIVPGRMPVYRACADCAEPSTVVRADGTRGYCDACVPRE